jgi:cell division protein FtsZ
MSTPVTDGANALKLDNEVTSEPAIEISSSDLINDQVMKTQENEMNTNIEDKSTSVNDSSLTEEINEQSSNGLENFGFDDETPELFNLVEDSPVQEFTSLENEHKEPEEDDLEIPAFLRRQKN